MVGGLYLGHTEDLPPLKHKKNIRELSTINNDDTGIKKIPYRLKTGIYFLYTRLILMEAIKVTWVAER